MQKYLELKTGCKIPMLGLGTWQLTGKQCENIVEKALEYGYEHIDTADAYGNHKEIAKAISNFNRKKIFLTTKIIPDKLHYDSVLSACDRFLKELNTNYLDLLLIHWPNNKIPIRETLEAFKELQKQKKIHSFGVSNFTIHHLEDSLKVNSKIVSVNQVEFHPYLYQKELLEFCQTNKIVLTAYSPLGRKKTLNDNAIKEIAKANSKTEAQVCLKWLLQKNIAVIPKASSEEHLKENMQLFDWKLSKEDEKRIDEIGIKERIINPSIGEFDY